MGHGDNTGNTQIPTVRRDDSSEKADHSPTATPTQQKLRQESTLNPLTSEQLQRFGPQGDHIAQLVAFYDEGKGSKKGKAKEAGQAEPSSDRQADAGEKRDPSKPLFGIDNASIAKRDAAGKVALKDGKPDYMPLRDVLNANHGTLPAGDYELRFAIQSPEKGKEVYREGRLTIPSRDPANADKPMALVTAVHGVNPLHPNVMFAKNLPLDKVVDKKDTAVFWPYAQRLPGEGAAAGTSSYRWNMHDSLRDKDAVDRQIKKDGYDDGRFILESLKVAEQSANAKSEGVLGHSQGASVAMKLATLPETAGKFPKIALFCGAMDTKIKSFAKPAAGNGTEVFVFDPGNDNLVFNSENGKVAGTSSSQSLLASLSKLGQSTLGLDDIDTKNASPTKLIQYYMDLLGPAYSQNTFVTAAKTLSKGIADFNVNLKDHPPYVAGSKTAKNTLFDFISPTHRLRVVHAPSHTHAPPGEFGALAAMDFFSGQPPKS